MAQSFTTDALKALLVYPFEDARWKSKFLIGSLILLANYAIPVVPFILLYGYTAQIMRRIIVEDGEPFLPEWDEWGRLLTDGLKIFGVGFIYMLPLLLLMLVGVGLFFGAMLVPTFFIGTAPSPGEGPPPAAILSMVTGTLGGTLFFMLGMLVSLIVGVFVPVAIGHVIATDKFEAGFRFQELWAIFRANLTGFIVVYALVIGLSMALSLIFQLLYLTIIFCCLYPLILPPVWMYIGIISNVLFAQAYREGVRKLAAQPATA